ncbi:Putative fluoride ion transporter CrcB [bacterium HR36]|nr:Putative fluoride ion transporter CrcB [bacterium HR36]
MPTIEKVLWLATAGSLGTLARWALSGLVHRYWNGSFPSGTMTVNVMGCFLFGIIWQLGQQRLVLRTDVRFIVLAGFMGAFTTFSTFVFETDNLLRTGQWWYAAGNLFGQIILGLIGLRLGIALVQWL